MSVNLKSFDSKGGMIDMTSICNIVPGISYGSLLSHFRLYKIIGIDGVEYEFFGHVIIPNSCISRSIKKTFRHNPHNKTHHEMSLKRPYEMFFLKVTEKEYIIDHIHLDGKCEEVGRFKIGKSMIKDEKKLEEMIAPLCDNGYFNVLFSPVKPIKDILYPPTLLNV